MCGKGLRFRFQSFQVLATGKQDNNKMGKRYEQMSPRKIYK